MGETEPEQPPTAVTPPAEEHVAVDLPNTGFADPPASSPVKEENQAVGTIESPQTHPEERIVAGGTSAGLIASVKEHVVQRVAATSKGILKRRLTPDQTFSQSGENGNDGIGEGCSAKMPRTKRLGFRDVTVYYFRRTQGFTCVPSQGGITLGMSKRHSHVETFSLSGYAKEKHRTHLQLLKEHRRRIMVARQAYHMQQLQQYNQMQSMAAQQQPPACPNPQQFPAFQPQTYSIYDSPASPDPSSEEDEEEEVGEEDCEDESEDEDEGNVEVEEEDSEEEEEEESESDESGMQNRAAVELPWPLNIPTPPRTNDADDDDDESTNVDGPLVDNYFFLQPVPSKRRRALLRASGVEDIDFEEKEECRSIRSSREVCGCNCQKVCVPESCLCARAGITCQVDRMNFPCGCDRLGCNNPAGRVEFNPSRVRNHLMKTLMRLDGDKQQPGTSSAVPLPSTSYSMHGQQHQPQYHHGRALLQEMAHRPENLHAAWQQYSNYPVAGCSDGQTAQAPIQSNDCAHQVQSNMHYSEHMRGSHLNAGYYHPSIHQQQQHHHHHHHGSHQQPHHHDPQQHHHVEVHLQPHVSEGHQQHHQQHEVHQQQLVQEVHQQPPHHAPLPVPQHHNSLVQNIDHAGLRNDQLEPITPELNINGLIQVDFGDVDSTSSTISCIDEDELHASNDSAVEDNPRSPDSFGELIKKSIVETVSA